jgi:hypothetical protein
MSILAQELTVFQLGLEPLQRLMGKLRLLPLLPPKQLLLVETEQQPLLQRFRLGISEFVLARPIIKFRTITNKGELNELRL